MRVARLAVLGLTSLSLPAQDWTALTATTHDPRLVHDLARDRLVAIGAPIREWDGARWLETHVPNAPPGVLLAALRCTYDQARRHIVVLYGPNTWAYDGASWRLLAAANPAQFESSTRSIVYDPIRQVVVYYNPLPGSQATHEWDGAAWRSVPATLPGLLPLAMGFDPTRGRIVAFTWPFGTSGNAHEYDGTTWRTIPGVTLPASFPDREPTLFTDPVRNRLIAYGGIAGNQVLGTAWEWDGVAWNAIANGPPRWRAGVGMEPGTGRWLIAGGYVTDTSPTAVDETWAYDGAFHRLEVRPILNRIVADPQRRLVVGWGPEGTWEWNGGSWTQRTTSTPIFLNLVHDPVRSVVIGLENDFSLPIVRLWLWDGLAWHLQSPAVTPPWQFTQVAAWDHLHQEMVIFGLHGTWTWNGANWTQRAPSQSPPRTWQTPGSAAWDPLTQRVVLVLKVGAGSEEWEWNGVDWNRRPGTGLPATWSDGQLAFDPRSGRFLLVTNTGTWRRENGVWLPSGSGNRNSWRLAADPTTGLLKSYGPWAGYAADPASVELLGAGCAGPGMPLLAPQGRPQTIGGRLRLDLHGAPPHGIGAVYAGLQPAAVPLGSCTLLLDAPVHCATLVANAAGFASYTLVLPDRPVLLGLEAWFQGVVVQPGGPVAGVAALTNGVRVRVGD